ncbi:hypothetical protein, partial [Escherichia coli]|uniref:hypothetical protein n=1 Tax=Escherichia coli TaxID=562 RepID=UPI00234D98C9
ATFNRLQEQASDYLKELILSGKMIENEIYSDTKLAIVIHADGGIRRAEEPRGPGDVYKRPVQAA